MNKNVLKIFLVWPGLLLAVGFFVVRSFLYGGGKCDVGHQLPYYRWDSFRHTLISRHGYNFSEVKNSSIAFLLLFSAFLTGTLTSRGRYALLGFPVLMGPAVYFVEKRGCFCPI